MASQQGKAKRKKFFGARFTSTISVALVLFVLGLMALGALTAARLTGVLRERFTITVTVADAAPAGFASGLADQLRRDPWTARVTYVSADSALAILTAELGENPQDFLDYNPMQESVELQLQSHYAVADSIERVVATIRARGGARIESIDYNRTLVDVVNSNLRRVGIGMAVLAAVLLLISFSLIGNTVRLALHSDRFLINTMRLVGATGWFIRRPFVVAHMWCGLIAALLALAAIAATLYFGLSHHSAHVLADLVLRPVPLAVLAGGLIVVGMLIPVVAAWRTTSRYLRMSVDELYLV